MFTNRSIAYKLILVITACSAVIFTVTIGYFYHSSRVTLERELENNARNLVFASVNSVETDLTAIGTVAEGISRSLETGAYSKEALNRLLKGTLAAHKGIYGIGQPLNRMPALSEQNRWCRISTGKTAN